MLQQDTLYAEGQNFSAESVSLDPPYELTTESNIDHLGHTIRVRGPVFWEVSKSDDHGNETPESRWIDGDWKPQGFIHNESGLFIKLMGNAEPNRVNSPRYALFPPKVLSGLRTVDLEDGNIALAFRYYKQFEGEEKEERLLIPKGFAYGVHPGHVGDPGTGIEPEPTGWYIVGDQVKRQDGQIIVVGERNFPLSRIINGPIGDPRDSHHRDIYGLY